MKIERVEILSKIIPIGGIYIILCSSIKLILFYKQFNISITDYLSIGEYATLFIDDIVYYLAVFGIGILLYEIDPYLNKEPYQESENHDFKKYKKEKKWIILTSGIVTIIIIILLFYADSFYLKLEVIKSGLFLLLVLIRSYLLFVKTSFKISYRGVYLIAILYFSTIDGFIDANKIIENEDNLNYVITFENIIINTNDDLHYLGKSENFIYLYNLKNNEAMVYPTSKLDKIQIVKKK